MLKVSPGNGGGGCQLKQNENIPGPELTFKAHFFQITRNRANGKKAGEEVCVLGVGGFGKRLSDCKPFLLPILGNKAQLPPITSLCVLFG